MMKNLSRSDAYDEMLDCLYRVIPYIEDAMNDPCNKKDVVKELLINLHNAIKNGEKYANTL